MRAFPCILPHNGTMDRRAEILERFMRYVSLEPNTGCWLWMAAYSNHGHGTFKVNRRCLMAHRVAYMLFIGDIPKGHDLHHACEVRGCVNPQHLKPVPHLEHLVYTRRKREEYRRRPKETRPLQRKRRTDPLVRLWRFISPEPNTGCWLWTGGGQASGYGLIAVGGRQMMAHRLAYLLLRGDPCEGKDLHHKCGMNCCVNPDHLQPVVRREHMVQLSPGSVSHEAAKKTHCPKGHPYDEENTYFAPTKYGVGRSCRECRRQQQSRVRFKRRGGPPGPRQQDKTHCPHGHTFSPENTYLDSHGWRHCRACRAEVKDLRAAKEPA